jgi:phosphoglycerate kinase
MKRSVESVEISGKRVLLRADFNSPVENGKVIDDTRIQATIPTIKYLLDRGARLILCSHQGRPDGMVNPKYSLAPIAHKLSEDIEKPVPMAPDCIGWETKKLVMDLAPGNMLLLENLRFHKEEEENDPMFAQELASFAEVYVNDAFGCSHRKHASTFGVPSILKPAVAGFLVIKELQYLDKNIKNPLRPFAVVFGGAKVTDKIKVVKNLACFADIVVIGGGMAYTFLKAQGFGIGNSILQEDMIDKCKVFLAQAKAEGKKVLLPIDSVVADRIDNPEIIKVVDGSVPEGFIGVDIGPKTSELFSSELQKCGTVLWNGPLGVFENDRFAQGTKAVMSSISGKVKVTVIGGGDSAAAAAKFGLSRAFTHVSTGGGASLEFLEGKELPGVSILDDI